MDVVDVTFISLESPISPGSSGQVAGTALATASITPSENRELQWKLMDNDIGATIDAHGTTATVTAGSKGGTVSVRVCDSALTSCAAATKELSVWGLEFAQLFEMEDGKVTGHTTGKAYPGEHVFMSICPGHEFAISGEAMPNDSATRNKIRWNVYPTSTDPGASGSLATSLAGRTVSTTDGIFYAVSVWADHNANGVLDANEPCVQFQVGSGVLVGAVQDRRSSAPVEKFYRVDLNEHQEVGGTFQFQYVGNAFDPLLRYQLIETNGWDTVLKAGSGRDFPHTWNAERTAYVRYYVDCIPDGKFDSDTEMKHESPEFSVLTRRVIAYDVEYSDQLPAGYQNHIPGWIGGAEEMIIRRDSGNDWRACVDLQINSVSEFTSGPRRPDPCRDNPKHKEHYLHLATDNWVFLQTLRNSQGGLSAIGSPGFIIENVPGPNRGYSNLVAHEIGHTRGLAHPGHAPPQIMHAGVLQPRRDDELTKSDAITYEDGPEE